MERALVLDGRNLYSPADMERHGFEYVSIGRQPVAASDPDPVTVASSSGDDS